MKNALLDEPRLAAIEARAAAAADGPWRAMLEGRDHSSGSSCIATATGGMELDASDADIEFMAAARDDVPYLLSELRRLAGLVEGR
ncbi:hypothetical protein PMI14_02827 [Acidovorax sp. CF316]|uniref:hypothetical protein n=1 Tax=Acidovorax sp. CF316 TaxID=1144317 RepID=UPI00026BDED6|nr:hypothetical protein [Acidovorax sp. CF316]EJE52514.1 hypothetical protein PMI14_02827 [Acidovorax sp. CF316]